jgi:hypothetical protein
MPPYRSLLTPPVPPSAQFYNLATSDKKPGCCYDSPPHAGMRSQQRGHVLPTVRSASTSICGGLACMIIDGGRHGHHTSTNDPSFAQKLHGAHISSRAFDCEEIHVSVDAIDHTRARVPLRLCGVSDHFNAHACMPRVLRVRATQMIPCRVLARQCMRARAASYMGNSAVIANERVSAALRSGWHVMRGHHCMHVPFIHEPSSTCMGGNDDMESLWQ